MNYLALGALKHYSVAPAAGTAGGTQRLRAGRLYKQLRKNLLRTILGEYHRTGFFWEQYEDTTGKGIRGHPCKPSKQASFC